MPQPGPQLLFFDLDDTLLDHRGSELAALGDVFEAYRPVFGERTLEEWVAVYRVVNGRLWVDWAKGLVGREELKLRRFSESLERLGQRDADAAEIAAFYIGRYEHRWRLVDGAEDVLADASRHGIVGIVTNGFRDLQHKKVARFGLDRWSQHLILSEDVGVMKPGREIFDAAARAADPERGGEGRRKVYIGDSFEHDVVGARGAGWMPIFFNPGQVTPPAPCLFVTRLGDLSPLLG
jgi:HAD superfamily hydrolase (TIGR01549 family)